VFLESFEMWCWRRMENTICNYIYGLLPKQISNVHL
jgi:hypothetical protein